MGRLPHARPRQGRRLATGFAQRNAFRNFRDLAAELALEVNADDAIFDGEIVKLDADRAAAVLRHHARARAIHASGPVFDVLLERARARVGALCALSTKELLPRGACRALDAVLCAGPSAAAAAEPVYGDPAGCVEAVVRRGARRALRRGRCKRSLKSKYPD